MICAEICAVGCIGTEGTILNTLYKRIENCVTKNRHFSQFFKPTRGFRQGSPISANLFVIIVEYLANAIRKNLEIIVININGIEFKLSQYADDTCFLLSNQSYLKAPLDMITFLKQTFN
jgi:hypothetical protein